MATVITSDAFDKMLDAMIKDEIERIVEMERERAIKNVEDGIRDVVDRMALRLASDYSVMMQRDEVVIHVKKAAHE